MSEDPLEKGITRRGALKLAGLSALGLIGVKLSADRVAEAQTNLRNPENLARFLGGQELFDGKHTNYPEVIIAEGAGVYKQPQKERSGKVNGPATTRIGTQTLMGTLGRGESIKVENPLLFLREADQFTNKAWVRDVTHEGVTKKADISRSWVIFEVKGQRLPESIKGPFPSGVACVPIEGANIDFGGSFEPDLQKMTFSQETSFGRITN